MAAKEEENPAQWALDLLEPAPVDQSFSVSKYIFVSYFGGIFTASALVSNVLTKKPLLANKSRIILTAAFGTLLGYVASSAADVYYSRRDAVMRDYVMLHPERFPEPSNRKYADVFKRWSPIR